MTLDACVVVQTTWPSENPEATTVARRLVEAAPLESPIACIDWLTASSAKFRPNVDPEQAASLGRLKNLEVRPVSA